MVTCTDLHFVEVPITVRERRRVPHEREFFESLHCYFSNIVDICICTSSVVDHYILNYFRNEWPVAADRPVRLSIAKLVV